MRLQLKKVEKASTSDDSVEEVTPGLGEAFNTWGGSPPPTAGIYDPVQIKETTATATMGGGGSTTIYTLELNTGNVSFLPPEESGKYYIFYYTLFIKDTNDSENVQFTQE